jgi:glutathione peroxidase
MNFRVFILGAESKPRKMKLILLSTLLSVFVFSAEPSIYDFKVEALQRENIRINFEDFKGKKILIVNTASKSPYTRQLEELEKLYRAYKEKLVIVGFPAGSDFGDQEFKTNREIRDFCTFTYDITFPMAEKVTTVGEMRHPIFSYLISEAKKLSGDESVIKWNFTKFLIDENGKLVRVFSPEITPLSTEITSYLNNTRNW